MDKKKFNKIRLLAMAAFTLFGSASRILYKNISNNHFYFPLYQVFIMYIGEILLFPACIIKKLQNKTEKKLTLDSNKQTFTIKSKLLVFSLASLLDAINVFIEDFCLESMNPSDFLSLKMTVIYYIIVYKFFIIKRKSFRHQWLGLGIFTIGIFLFLICFMLASNRNDREYGMYIGLMLAAEFFMSVQLLIIEHFSWKFDATAAEISSIKGFSGLILCGIIYLSKYFLHLDHDLLSISKPFQIVYSDKTLAVLTTVLIFVLAAYNFLFYFLIKITESLAACTVDSGRIIVVSIFYAFSYNLKWLPLEIAGTACIYIGLSIYNELLILPCCGLKKSAKESININKLIRKKRAEARMWIHGLDIFAKNPNANTYSSLNI